MLRAVLIAAPLSAGLHLLIGWEWTLAAGILAGVLAPTRGGRSGMLAVGAAWGGILLWSMLSAPAATAVLLDVIGGLVGGNTPGAIIVALTLVFGALIGLTGGFAGAQMRLLVAPAHENDRSQQASAASGTAPADV